jgi:hypothetical protein
MLDDIKVTDKVEVEFSDPKSDWKEIVNFHEFINVILEFIKKLLKFEFDM